MSLFTGLLSPRPSCPRCGSPQFVVLVRQDNPLSIWDCKKCGPVISKPKGQKEARG